MSFLDIFKPGLTKGQVNFARFAIILELFFVFATWVLTKNIHFFIMTLFSICLFGSFEYLIQGLRQNNILYGTPEDEKKEEDEKEKEEKNEGKVEEKE